MSQQPNNNTKWIIAAVIAAVVVLCGAVFVCAAAGIGAFLIGQRQESQVYRNFPGIPVVPELQPDEVLPEEFFPFQTPDSINGALVQEVVPGSPADQAGIQPGDLITAIDGQEITPEQGLVALVQSYEPGDTVTVTYLRFRGARRGQFDAEIELAENPDLPGRAYLGVRAMDLFMEP